jgi:hypothetical protein
MRAVVVYESMYGNTRLIAEAIGRGLTGGSLSVEVVPVGHADAAAIEGADLVVVGGPTHAHGMSRPSTRKAAGEAAAKPDSGVVLEPGYDGPGVREWTEGQSGRAAQAAAFDTRIKGPAAFTGRASKGVARSLRRRGFGLVLAPESFLVTTKNQLLDGEEARAEAWGRSLALALTAGARRAS